MCNLSQGIMEQGMQQGIQQGAEQEKRQTAVKLYSKQWNIEDIADFVNRSIETVENWLGLAQA